MKKTILLLMVLVAVVSISGCTAKKEKSNKLKELQINLKDNIKATAKIKTITDGKIVKVDFKRQDENTKVKVNLKYYSNDSKESLYEENMIYNFPNKDTECIMEIPIRTEIIKLKEGKEDAIDNKEYTEENTTKEKLNYDYLKLNISKIESN